MSHPRFRGEGRKGLGKMMLATVSSFVVRENVCSFYKKAHQNVHIIISLYGRCSLPAKAEVSDGDISTVVEGGEKDDWLYVRTSSLRENACSFLKSSSKKYGVLYCTRTTVVSIMHLCTVVVPAKAAEASNGDIYALSVKVVQPGLQ